MFEKEAEERTEQYMNEHTEKYNCELTKLETDNHNAGREQGYEDGFKDHKGEYESSWTHIIKTDFGE